MRGHCQRLCTLSGPERSRLCLSYCLSFPNDPVCPEPGVVEDLMARGKPPTPSPSPPVFQQPLQPLLFSAANMSTALSTSPTTWPAVPVLSIKQLALGYNPFLGLEPHEQLGVYTRNEIFQFHLDPENVFLVQAPNPNLQANTVARFLAPLEYYVTPALADCSYMNQEANTLSKSRSEYMATSSRSKSMGAEAQPGGKLSRAGGSTVDTTTDEISKTIPGLGGEISPQISVSASVGNSRESQTGRNYEAQGQTKSITTRLKRAYYKAGLRVDRFHKESFTPSFRSDARELGHRPYSFTATIEFITKYGAYIFDGATMGASLYRSYFFSEDTGDSDISKLTKMDSFANVNALVTSKSTRGTSQTEDLEGGNTITYSYTDIERIGEFNTGSSSADSIGETNSCAIGATISPQVRTTEWKGTVAGGANAGSVSFLTNQRTHYYAFHSRQPL